MPVHDMTRAASSIIGAPATGNHARCPECGYGTVIGANGAALLVHSARCPRAVGDRYVACRLQSCRAVLDPARVAHGATACNERHKTAAWKIERCYGRHDAVVASGRANGSQARKKASGAQVSYHKAALAVARAMAGPLWNAAPESAAHRYWLAKAKRALRPALSDRQRAQLDARERSSDGPLPQ